MKNNIFFKKLNYGLGINSLIIFVSRLEIRDFSFFKTTSIRKIIIEHFFNNYLFKFFKYSDILIFNVYLLVLLRTYKGWRHSRGLPVRGQRTWSNGWSSYKSNLTYRLFRVELAKKIYGLNYNNKSITSFIAEEVNILWKNQWVKEWISTKKKRLKYVKKKKKESMKINVDLISKIFISTRREKKKKNQSQNQFLIGFDSGFTKKLI